MGSLGDYRDLRGLIPLIIQKVKEYCDRDVFDRI